jgi:hypothetical protein
MNTLETEGDKAVSNKGKVPFVGNTFFTENKEL